jgi:hypothetical protein
MKTRGILLARILETILLCGVIFTLDKTGSGLSFSILAVNFDFTWGVTRAGDAVLLSTRLFGYLMSLVGTVAHGDLQRDRLVYASLALASLGIASHASELLRAVGLIGVSVQAQCSALVLVVDWVLYARLVRARVTVGQHPANALQVRAGGN